MSTPEMTEEERLARPSYVAYCGCGCGGIIMATVDTPERKKEVARDVADCIRHGLAVERVTVGFVRGHEFGCKKKKAEKKSQPDLFQAEAQP